MRHGDKPDDPNDANLSEAGSVRAEKLAKFIPALYGKPDFVFAAAASKKSLRSCLTMMPLCDAHGRNGTDAWSPRRHGKPAACAIAQTRHSHREYRESGCITLHQPGVGPLGTIAERAIEPFKLQEVKMATTLLRANPRFVFPAVLAALLLVGGCATNPRDAGHRVVLQGSQEVPSVSTSATGSGVITVGPDRSISGSFTTSGITSTAAHVHEGARGTNGPVILPLVRTDANVWTVPAGSRLTDAQYAAHRAGNLYVNVHSAAHPNGEIRAQIGS